MRRLASASCVHQDFVSAVMDVDYSPTGREFVAGSYDRSGGRRMLAGAGAGSAAGCWIWGCFCRGWGMRRAALLHLCLPACMLGLWPRAVPVARTSPASLLPCTETSPPACPGLPARSAHLLLQRRAQPGGVPHKAHAARVCGALQRRRDLRPLRWVRGWLGGWLGGWLWQSWLLDLTPPFAACPRLGWGVGSRCLLLCPLTCPHLLTSPPAHGVLASLNLNCLTHTL